MVPRIAFTLLIMLGFASTATIAAAETIREALALAYSNNPTLNAQRTATRSVDEGVPLAKSGWLPSVFLDATYRIQHNTNIIRGPNLTNVIDTKTYGITIQQTLWDSYKTLNTVEAANAAVLASRETLRNTEQNTLFDTASAYADVIQARSVERFRAESLNFLNEQVRSERIRFEVGESTRTDVSQAEAQRDAAVSLLETARAQTRSSEAVYRQLVGRNPGNLRDPGNISIRLPTDLNRALGIARAEHPAIRATQHLVDQASFNVKASESDTLPTLTLQGTSQRSFEASEDLDTETSTLTAQLRIPIYQGGRVAAQVRQGKEILGQRRIEVDQSIDQVRAATVNSFSQLTANRAVITSTQSQLRAARLALNGVLEERAVGQRTTLDVLNTQQQVIDAQIALAQARRNVVVAEYALVLALGRLSSRNLGLQVAHYDAEDHFIKVKDRWYGLRTPDATR